MDSRLIDLFKFCQVHNANSLVELKDTTTGIQDLLKDARLTP